VKIAQRAARGKAHVFGDIGPLGELIKPYGQLAFDEAHAIFKKLVRMFSDAGTQFFFIETLTSMIEAKAAFLAARQFSEHVFICFSLQDNGKTIMGETPESLAVTFDALGARGIGINCTLPEVAREAVARMAEVTRVPLIIKPNAGKIKIVGTTMHHTLSDADMARLYNTFVNAGASIIGGCCGTSPAFVRMLRRKTKKTRKRSVARRCLIASPHTVFAVDFEKPFIVGERLNPAGSKRVRKALVKHDYAVYGEEARAQERAGAHFLDVNAYHVDFDERAALENALFEVLKNSSLPIFVDTQNYRAAEYAMTFYPGVGVYNSIPCRKRALQRWLPMVKKYGFKAVISLVGTRIPQTVEERMENVERALQVASSVGVPPDDLIFDPLVFSASTEREQIKHTLEAVALLRKRKLKTVLGISNVSFGLPNRSQLNAALVTAAIKSGTTFLIINPLDEIVMQAISGANTLFGVPVGEAARPARAGAGKARNLIGSIMQGNDRMSLEFAQKLLASGTSAQDIIDKHISRALKKVGDEYEAGSLFVPDLLRAAEASQRVLVLVNKYLPRRSRKGKVIFATVKGDIHDIGKNIAALIFGSAGYEVIDLGKDVSCTKIIHAVKKHKPVALGLSALLTTTMPEMGHVTEELRKHGLKTRVIIGGPNVTPAYAKRIGAFGAARTVLEGLKLMRKRS
jgi:5-methyltetrahydrofolate--homocysteine methyltransferase